MSVFLGGLHLFRARFDFQLVVHGDLACRPFGDVLDFDLFLRCIHRAPQSDPVAGRNNLDVLGSHTQRLVLHEGLADGLRDLEILGALGLVAGRECSVVPVALIFTGVVRGVFSGISGILSRLFAVVIGGLFTGIVRGVFVLRQYTEWKGEGGGDYKFGAFHEMFGRGCSGRSGVVVAVWS